MARAASSGSGAGIASGRGEGGRGQRNGGRLTGTECPYRVATGVLQLDQENVLVGVGNRYPLIHDEGTGIDAVRINLTIEAHHRRCHGGGAAQAIQGGGNGRGRIRDPEGSVSSHGVENQIVRDWQLPGNGVELRPGLALVVGVGDRVVGVGIGPGVTAVKTACQSKGRRHGKTY